MTEKLPIKIKYPWLNVNRKLGEYIDPEYYKKLLKEYTYRGKSDIELFTDFAESQLIGRDNLKVLELGCGTGRVTTEFLSKFGDNVQEIHLVDLSSEMLESSKQNLQYLKNILFQKSDIIDFLAETNEKYDFVFAIWSISTSIHQKMLSLGEEEGRNFSLITLKKFVKDNLKPGGSIFILHYDSLSDEQRIKFHHWAKVLPFFKNPDEQSPSKQILDDALNELIEEDVIDFNVTHLYCEPIEYESLEEALEIYMNFHFESFFNDDDNLEDMILELSNSFKPYFKDGKYYIVPRCFVYTITKSI